MKNNVIVSLVLISVLMSITACGENSAAESTEITTEAFSSEAYSEESTEASTEAATTENSSEASEESSEATTETATEASTDSSSDAPLTTATDEYGLPDQSAYWEGDSFKLSQYLLDCEADNVRTISVSGGQETVYWKACFGEWALYISGSDYGGGFILDSTEDKLPTSTNIFVPTKYDAPRLKCVGKYDKDGYIPTDDLKYLPQIIYDLKYNQLPYSEDGPSGIRNFR